MMISVLGITRNRTEKWRRRRRGEERGGGEEEKGKRDKEPLYRQSYYTLRAGVLNAVPVGRGLTWT